MNKKQRAIIIGGIVAIIIMFLFPPYASYRGYSSKFQKGYHVNYLLKPSEEQFSLDIGTLSIQYVTVIIIGSLLWILARDTKLKDNLKGDDDIRVCPNCGTKNKILSGRPVDKAKCGKCKQSLYHEDDDLTESDKKKLNDYIP